MLKRKELTPNRIAALIDHINDAIFVINSHTASFIYVNNEACQSLGYERDELLKMGVTDVEITIPENILWVRHVEELKRVGPSVQEGVHKRKDGLTFPVEVNIKHLTLDGESFVIAIARDISERKKMEDTILRNNEQLEELVTKRTKELMELNDQFKKKIDSLADTESKLKHLLMAFDESINVLFITDNEGKIEYINKRFTETTGYSKKDVLNRNPRILSSGNTHKSEYKELWNTIKSGKTWRGVFKNRKKNGEYYWSNGVISPVMSDNGEITHFLAIQEDITDRKNKEEQIEYLSKYDKLTGLINRASFTDVLSDFIRDDSEHKLKGVLLLIDIDNFKFINDTYGHSIGDEFLSRVAGLIKNSLAEMNVISKYKDTNMISRMSKDEFIIFLPETETSHAVESAENIRQAIEKFSFTDSGIRATSSIGIALYPEHGVTINELLKRIDAAVYRAKELGRNKYHICRNEDIYFEKMHKKHKEKEQILIALEEDRIIPWFQPILDLRENRIYHFEALARMIGEKGEIISPGAFIGAAETFGLVGKIDKVITSKVMSLQAELRKEGKSVSFSLNLSGKSLGDEELLNFIKSHLKESGADPGCIVFEITETEAIRDLKEALHFIKVLKETGCLFSLDDFGVGFTSFVYLREMKVDFIKIDGSFIKKLPESKDDQTVVKAITNVAKEMNIKVIAEFVENGEIIDFLKLYEIDYAQGYHIGKPAPELQFVAPGA